LYIPRSSPILHSRTLSMRRSLLLLLLLLLPPPPPVDQ
jgi:hypothetical protein